MSAALAFALCSCSDDDETEGDFTPTVFNVMGKVEKGPMIRGSHVDMRTLDEYMTPTGNFYLLPSTTTWVISIMAHSRLTARMPN